MAEVEIICLANSRKLSGRCVAGIDDRNGRWVRPVSGYSDGTLLQRHYRLHTGADASLLDRIRIVVESSRPESYQPENWLISEQTWVLVGHLSEEEAATALNNFIQTDGELIRNATDRISTSELDATPLVESLVLVEPQEVEWVITENFRGKRQERVNFSLGGTSYNLSLTDPVWADRLAELEEGVHPLKAVGVDDPDRVLFTVSVGEPFNGYCFKLVAAVIVI